MKTIKTAPLYDLLDNLLPRTLLGVLGVACLITLNGCATSEPSTWEKSSSPWDQRRTSGQAASAPAAETYKADLEMPETSEVELSYETESVDSFSPPVAVGSEPVSEPVSEIETPDVGDTQSLADDASIMDQPADYYTMQLMASVDIDRVIRFADENQVSTKYIVATNRDGVTWHVLLLGIYPDYSSAVAARDEIAPSLKNAPWIRKVGSVQKLVH